MDKGDKLGYKKVYGSEKSGKELIKCIAFNRKNNSII